MISYLKDPVVNQWFLGNPEGPIKTIKQLVCWKRTWSFSRDLFHQHFQGTIFLKVFDFQDVFSIRGWCFVSYEVSMVQPLSHRIHVMVYVSRVFDFQGLVVRNSTSRVYIYIIPSQTQLVLAVFGDYMWPQGNWNFSCESTCGNCYKEKGLILSCYKG